MGWGPIGDIVSDVADVAKDVGGAVSDAASSVGNFVKDNWKTIAVIAATTVVFVGVMALTGGLAGPALLAFGGPLLATGVEVAAAGAASGLTGYVLGNWLNDQPITWQGALTAVAISTVVSVATAGVGSKLTPFISEATTPIVNSVLGDAVDNAVPRAVTAAVTRAAAGGPLAAGGQVLQNALTGQPLDKNLGQAFAVGTITGAVQDPLLGAFNKPVGAGAPVTPEAPAGLRGMVGRLLGREPVTSEQGSGNTQPVNVSTDPNATGETRPLGALGEDIPVVDRATWDPSVLRSIENPNESPLGPYRATRVRPALDSLNEPEFNQFQRAVDGAGSDAERAYLFKALGAGDSVAEVEWLANAIRGKNQTWLDENLTLSQGRSPVQQYAQTCGVTTAQVLKGDLDPVYALRLRQHSPMLDAVDPNNPKSLNPRLAREQEIMTRTKYKGGLPGMADHRGVTAPIADPAGGSGRFVDDWFSSAGKSSGLQYQTEFVSTPDRSIQLLDWSLGQGIETPIVVGNAPGEYSHYLLATQTRTTATGHDYLLYDPGNGSTTWVSDAAIRAGNLGNGFHNQINAVEVPRGL